VKAVDAAGNEGQPAVYGFDIDLSSPTASFRVGASSRPPALSNINKATFLLEADEALYELACMVGCAPHGPKLFQDMNGIEISRLQFGPCPGLPAGFVACPDVVHYDGLSSAIHRFQVRATDAVGNVQLGQGANGR
jgi:hypothetical protein